MTVDTITVTVDGESFDVSLTDELKDVLSDQRVDLANAIKDETEELVQTVKGVLKDRASALPYQVHGSTTPVGEPTARIVTTEGRVSIDFGIAQPLAEHPELQLGMIRDRQSHSPPGLYVKYND